MAIFYIYIGRLRGVSPISLNTIWASTPLKHTLRPSESQGSKLKYGALSRRLFIFRQKTIDANPALTL